MINKLTFMTVLFLQGLLAGSVAMAQVSSSYGYSTPQVTGKVVEKECAYTIKTARAKQNLCRLLTTQLSEERSN